jgi:dihydrofolate reductase
MRTAWPSYWGGHPFYAVSRTGPPNAKLTSVGRWSAWVWSSPAESNRRPHRQAQARRHSHIVVWGGVSLWRSLMRLDLIDEFRLDLHPYVAGEGTRLFDDVPKSYRLDLVSSTAFSNGTVGLYYRRHR